MIQICSKMQWFPPWNMNHPSSANQCGTIADSGENNMAVAREWQRLFSEG